MTEFEVQIDTATVCRVCLQTSEEEMISIYERDNRDSSLCLYEKIELCSGIKILTDPELPSQICAKCNGFLHLAHKFRIICKRSDSYLREYVIKNVSPTRETGSSNSDGVTTSTNSGLNHTSITPTTVSSNTPDFVETKSEINEEIDEEEGDVFYLDDGLSQEHLQNSAYGQAQNLESQYTNIEIHPGHGVTNEVVYDEIIDPYNDEINEFNEETEWDEDGNADYIVEEIPGFIEENSNESTESVKALTARKTQITILTRKKTLDISSDGTAVITEQGQQSQDVSQQEDEEIQLLNIKPNKSSTTTTITLSQQQPQVQQHQQQRQNQSESHHQNHQHHLQKTNDRSNKKTSIINRKTMHICEICGNSYQKKYALEIHMRRHRNERPHECEICGEAFHFNFQLTRHIRRHTGARPYSCQYCKRKFTDRSTMLKHERLHRNERPYACKHCGKTFTYSSVLKAHILTHTGEKPFNCRLCGKRFSRSHHLKTHLETLIHQNNPEAKELLKNIRRDEHAT